MSDSRDLAKQAFNLLQNALAKSEARAEELSAELARKPVNKDKLANKVSVLSHRLESIEAECQRWQREAGQLEEVLANERVKYDALKRKLAIAESGPDKLTKKEINYWRASAEKTDNQINAYKTRIAALKGELREREAELQAGGAPGNSDSECEQRLAATEADAEADASVEVDQLQTEIGELRTSLQMAEAGLHEANRAREDLNAQLNALNRQIEEGTSLRDDYERQAQLASKQLEEARARESALQSELEAAQAALANRDRESQANVQTSETVDQIQGELERAQQEANELRTALERAEMDLAELGEAREGLAAELAEFHRRVENEQSDAREAGRRLDEVTRELEQSRQREAAVRAELDNSRHSSEGPTETTQELNNAVAIAENKVAETETALEELRDELREEKEYSANLSELANSRQDEITKLQDDVEEARERYEDARWRLEKASYFERLVARRKGLIQALIAALRAKNKAMVALKAGLDSLRTHKAMLEDTQQKLLARMEVLKKELGAAKERIKEMKAQSESATAARKADADTQNTALQERLATQAELIQSLEDEVKAAKSFKLDAESKDSELAQLQEELETKNTIIARLQSDIEDQQRKLAKLRGSDSETLRLKALTEKDRAKIDVLERENTELRAMIESAEQSGSGGGFTDEREIELQAKIAELTESVEKWKKKYHFLAAEAPAAYQNETAAKR
jgi:chromosome segregation ATPase